MENNVTKTSKWKIWIFWVVVAVALVALIGFYVWDVILYQAPGTIRDGVLYLNSEEMYVYSSLESALTDTKGENGPPKPLKEFLPEILAKEKLVYLEGTTVGICIDNKITEEELQKGKKDRVVYKIDNYFLAESIQGE